MTGPYINSGQADLKNTYTLRWTGTKAITEQNFAHKSPNGTIDVANLKNNIALYNSISIEKSLYLTSTN